jgi:palmitoyl-protein thioesterase
VAAFPQCSPATPIIGGVCAELTEVLGSLAYHPIVQNHLFQAGYFRDPTHLNRTDYIQNSQLAQWNGEGARSNASAARANWAKTKQFVWVRGTADTVVWPNEGEQWGALSAGYPHNKSVVPMRQARWYVDDAFGLRTADEAGRNAFEEYDGEHIRFTAAELQEWLAKYFAD